MLGTGLASGVKTFIVMPCLVESTPRCIEVWQGNVTEGITVLAVIVEAPSRISRSMLGVDAILSASGRIPSMLKRMVVRGIFEIMT